MPAEPFKISQNTFGGMDTDTAEEELPSNKYRYAKNFYIGSTQTGNLGYGENILGNTLVAMSLPAGTNFCIGALADNIGNRIIFCNYNSGGFHGIYQLDLFTLGVTTILENKTDSAGVDILRFNLFNLVKDMNLVDNRYLLFNDGLNSPKNIDVTRAIEGDYGTFTLQSIEAIKYAPAKEPREVTNINDPSWLLNNIKNNLFQFRYRYVYFDNTRSVPSPVSFITNLDGRAFPLLNNNAPESLGNAVQFTYDAPNLLIKAVEIMARTGNTGDWYLVESINLVNPQYKTKAVLTVDELTAGETYSLRITIDGDDYDISVIASIQPALVLLQDLADAINGTPILGTLVTATAVRTQANTGYLTITTQEFNVPFTISLVSTNLISVITDYVQTSNSTNTYTFRNNKQTSPIDPEEANQPYDYVPLIADAQEATQSRVLYGGVTEGYDNVAGFKATAEVAYKAGYEESFPQMSGVGIANDYARITIDTSPLQMAPGDVYNTNILYLSSSFTFYSSVVSGEAGDTPADIAAKIAADILNNYRTEDRDGRVYVVYFEGNDYFDISRRETLPDGSNVISDIQGNEYATAGVSVKGLKSGDTWNYGLAYYDAAGRFITVQWVPTLELNVPFRSLFENGSDVPYALLKVFSRPPIWAVKYAIVRTRRNYTGEFLQFAANVVGVEDDEVGIDLQNIPVYNQDNQTNLSYIFTEGDRVRFVGGVDGGEFIPGGIYVDVKIIRQDENGSIYISNNVNQRPIAGTLLEIYTPNNFSASLSEKQVFFEIGYFGIIGNPGASNRFHAVPLNNSVDDQSQSASDPEGTPLIVHLINDGDVWYRKRSIVSDGQVLPYPLYFIEDDSDSDQYDLRFNNIGRVNTINVDSLQKYFPARVRFSGPIIQDTLVNQINRFEALNREDYEDAYGGIKELGIRGQYLLCFQELRCGSIPLNLNIIYDNQGGQSLATTEKFLNKIQYMDVITGVGNHPESVVKNESEFYFVDTINGYINRWDLNGITILSKTYKFNRYTTDKCRFYNHFQAHIRGGYNKNKSEYVIYFQKVFDGESSYLTEDDTVAFCENVPQNEQGKAFSSHYSYFPDYMVTAQDRFFSFHGGKPYEHEVNETCNNFYGIQYDSEVHIVANNDSDLMKIFHHMKIDSVGPWFAPNAGDITTPVSDSYPNGMSSRLKKNNFALKEGKYWANFLRDMNDPTQLNPTKALFYGRYLRGDCMTIKLKNEDTTGTVIKGVYVFSSESNINF